MMREYLILHMSALAAGIILDILIGDPHSLPHPIRAIGTLIAHLEKHLKKPGTDGKNRVLAKGAVLWLTVMITTLTVTFGILAGVYTLNIYAGAVVEAVLSFYVLAAGSLRDESMKVYSALEEDAFCEESTGSRQDGGRLDSARERLSMIVGRDTESLDEAGIIRAAVETVAENTSDGVIAPLLYTFLGGPVLGMCYKAVNTMDSMLGYHNSEYEYFGKYAARADDVANFLPSRISAIFMIAAAGVSELSACVENVIFSKKRYRYSICGAARIWIRDRYKHKSPNSAQTESACAGALGIRLGGTSTYNGVPVEKPYIGDDTRRIEATDIKRAVRLMFTAEIICTAVIFTITGLIMIIR